MIVNESLVEYFSAIPYVIDYSWNPLPGWLTAETKIATYWLVGEAHRGVMGSTTTAMFLGDAWADLSLKNQFYVEKSDQSTHGD